MNSCANTYRKIYNSSRAKNLNNASKYYFEKDARVVRQIWILELLHVFVDKKIAKT